MKQRLTRQSKIIRTSKVLLFYSHTVKLQLYPSAPIFGNVQWSRLCLMASQQGHLLHYWKSPVPVSYRFCSNLKMLFNEGINLKVVANTDTEKNYNYLIKIYMNWCSKIQSLRMHPPTQKLESVDAFILTLLCV